MGHLFCNLGIMIRKLFKISVHVDAVIYNWASGASPTLGCSIKISRDIYMYCMSVCLVCQINCIGGIT